MKFLIIFFILFKLISIVKSDPPRCFCGDIYPTAPNTYVDWWIFEHFNKPTQDKKDLGSSFYTDSKLSTQNEKILELGYFDMREINKNSPITKTYTQMSNSKTFSSIAYNDGGHTSEKVGSAHEKGFFIWNEEGGIHVIHSIPHTPQKNDHFFLDSSTDLYLQHSVCITLKPEELDIIPKFLIYINPTISFINSEQLNLKALRLIDKNMVNNFNFIDTNEDLDDFSKIESFIEMDKIIEKNFIEKSVLPRKIKILKWAKLANHIAGNIKFTSDSQYTSMHYYSAKKHTFGEYFVQTSIAVINKSIKTDKDRPSLESMNKIQILWQYIGEYYTGFSKWMSQTMTKNSGFPEINVRGVDYSISLKLTYPFLPKSQQRSASKDHSKLMYGVSDNGQQKIFCLGGLNWQNVQDSRGGGAFCMKNIGYLVDYMKRHVSWTRLGITQDTAIKGVPHSTIGSEIDLSWVKNQLVGKKLLEPMGFEILVSQNSPHPLPKRVIEDASLEFKTMKAPLLIDAISKSTEEFSIDVFTSIKDKVHICEQSTCDYFSTIKSKIGTNLKLKVVVDPNLEFTMNFQDDPSFKNTIVVEQLTESYYFSSSLANIILSYYPQPAKKIYLRETDKNVNDFTFDFSSSHIKTPCDLTEDKDGNVLLEFHPNCIDQLTFCLYRHFKMNDLKKTSKDVFVDGTINHNTFYNDVSEVFKKIAQKIPDSITRCVAEPSDEPETDVVNDEMQSNSLNDLVENH
ncbi:hypothetical protein RB653_009596 [Dictyostelium firmibasis]|uniref:Uncharacterized protein n=1 Tax=Dictyostelium firmibasis TaxID=79012 RepID=A0AAN7YXI0_9MYCE